MSQLRASVIICTYNPRADILERVLDAIDRQGLSAGEYELIVVDNKSSPPLDAGWIQRKRSFALRLIREERQGNVFARQTGVEAARGPVLVFVDDDNILDPDYVRNGLLIMENHPTIGACGGITRGYLEGGMDEWKKALLPFLGVRDYGDQAIASDKDQWGQWEPIGAGMVFRKDVAMKYVEMVREILQTHTLGRKGNGLLAGEDSLLARAAYRLGYSCSYQPALKLTHFIKKQRLTTRYLCRLMYGHGRSMVSLGDILGEVHRPVGWMALADRLRYRVKREEWAGLIHWWWDVGYAMEARRLAGRSVV